MSQSSQSIKKTVLITGGNRGIGLSFCKAYLKKGWNVIVTSRDISKVKELEMLRTNSDKNNLNIVQMDVSNESSVNAMASNLQNTPIDVLISNAGIYETPLIDEQQNIESKKSDILTFDAESIMKEFRVNSLGPLLVTRVLLPNLLLKSSGKENSESFSKVINITSRMGSISDASSGGSYGYRASKAALNMFTKVLDSDFKRGNYPIATMALHPGYVQTDMTHGRGDISADDAVQKMIACIDRLDLTTSGKFIHRDGFEIPW